MNTHHRKDKNQFFENNSHENITNNQNKLQKYDLFQYSASHVYNDNNNIRSIDKNSKFIEPLAKLNMNESPSNNNEIYHELPHRRTNSKEFSPLKSMNENYLSVQPNIKEEIKDKSFSNKKLTDSISNQQWDSPFILKVYIN